MKSLLVMFLALLIFIPSYLYAQTAIVVDINKAKLVWNWSLGLPPNDGIADGYNVKCGSVSGIYTQVTPLTGNVVKELPVRQAIPGVGTWFCAVTAFNTIGESVPSNEVTFIAGIIPVAPSNLMIQVQ